MKNIFNYDNFQKHKLKYVIITILLCVFLYAMYNAYQTRLNHQHIVENMLLENFQTKPIVDILLGTNTNTKKNRLNVSEGIDKNNLLVLYSDYNIQLKRPNTSLTPKNNLVFMKIKSLNTGEKMLGDIVDTIPTINLLNIMENINNKNVPHKLKPIIKDDENSIPLEIKDKRDILNLFVSNEKTSTFLKLLNGLSNNSDNYNLEKVYKYFEAGYGDTLSIEPENINGSDIYKQINQLTHYSQIQKLILEIENLITDFNKLFTNKLILLLKNKKEELDLQSLNKKSKQKQYYVPFGFTINDINETLEFTNSEGKMVNRINFFLFLEKFNKILGTTSSIQFHKITIQGEEISYPFMILNKKVISVVPNVDYFNNLSENETVATELKYYTIKDNLQSYFDTIISINNFVEEGIKLPLNVIRTNHITNINDEHIIFGDLIHSSFDEIENLSDFMSNYIKLPKRCCQLIQPVITYERLNPVYEFFDDLERTIQIYQHPLYKTFRVFIKGDEIDNQHKKLPLYRIVPCVGKITLYEDNISTYNKLKKRCQEIKTMNKENPIYNNTFNQLQIKSKINEINENEVYLARMKKEISKLEKEIDKKDIVQVELNRSKLQKYNDDLSANVYKGYQKLISSNKDKINVNLLYTENIIKHLKEQCKAGNYTICKSDDNKDLIVDKIKELEDKIEEDRIKAEKEKEDYRLKYERLLSDYETKQRMKELGLKDKDYEKQLMDIIKLFPDKPDILFNDEQSSCFGCSEH